MAARSAGPDPLLSFLAPVMFGIGLLVASFGVALWWQNQTRTPLPQQEEQTEHDYLGFRPSQFVPDAAYRGLEPFYIDGADFAWASHKSALQNVLGRELFHWRGPYVPVATHYGIHELAEGSGVVLGVRGLYVSSENAREPRMDWLTIYLPAGIPSGGQTYSIPQQATVHVTVQWTHLPGLIIQGGPGIQGQVEVHPSDDADTLQFRVQADVRLWHFWAVEGASNWVQDDKVFEMALAAEYGAKPLEIDQYWQWRHAPGRQIGPFPGGRNLVIPKRGTLELTEIDELAPARNPEPE